MVDELDEQLQRYRNVSVEKGVNNWVHPLRIRDDQAVELQNVDASTPGLRAKRKGTSITATGITHGPILGLGRIKRHTGTDYLIAISQGPAANSHREVWTWAGSGLWGLRGVMTGHTAPTSYLIVPVQDLNYQLTGFFAVLWPDKSNIKRYGCDGVSLFETGIEETVARGWAFESFLDHGFAVDAGRFRQTVIYSDVGAPASTLAFGDAQIENVTQAFRMGGNSADLVIAIKGYRSQELIVFMTDRIEELIISSSTFAVGGTPTPATEWSRKVIDTTIGCAGRFAIAKVSEDIYFADQYGNIRSIARTQLDASQGTRSLPISQAIQGWVTRVNPAALVETVLEAYDRFLIVAYAIDSATSPDYVFVYDTVRNAWDGPWTGINPKHFVTATLNLSTNDELKKPILYAGTSETTYGEVLRMYDGTDDAGSTIEYKETTKRIDMGEYSLRKRWERIDVQAVGTANVDLTVEANVDGIGWQTVGTVNLLGGNPRLSIALPFILGVSGIAFDKLTLEELDPGYDIQFRFSCDTDEEVEILSWTLAAYVERYQRQVESE